MNPDIITLADAKLQFNGKISDENDVPVGFTTSTDGKYFVKYSLSQKVKKCEDLWDTLEFIINN